MKGDLGMKMPFCRAFLQCRKATPLSHPLLPISLQRPVPKHPLPWKSPPTQHLTTRSPLRKIFHRITLATLPSRPPKLLLLLLLLLEPSKRHPREHPPTKTVKECRELRARP